jgi:methylated-DNA-[protein]-cysteine S-methyltransferase
MKDVTTPRDDVAIGTLDTPVGRLTVAVTRIGLAAVSWGIGAALIARFGLPVVVDDDGRLRPVREQLAQYFGGQGRRFDVRLDWRLASGSQQPVLETLLSAVPYGSSITYGELAARSNAGILARGVGAVMGANPIPIVVPCHRVLAHDGLGGYSGGSRSTGLEVKRWLLTLEGVLPPTFDWSPAGLAGLASPTRV